MAPRLWRWVGWAAGKGGLARAKKLMRVELVAIARKGGQAFAGAFFLIYLAWRIATTRPARHQAAR